MTTQTDITSSWRTRLRDGLPDTRLAVGGLTLAFWFVSVAMCYALLATPVHEGRQGLMNITESFGALERVALWQRALSWIPGGHADGSFVSWPKPLIVWVFRICLAVMFLLQWLAFRTAWRSSRFSLWAWLIGPIGCQLIMLLMVPSNADIFYYAMSGDMANNGINPYLNELSTAPENPLYPYNHWVGITTVYGPLWTLINQAIVGVVGNDPTRAMIAYKVFFGVVAIALAGGVWWAARLLGARSRFAIAAAVLVAWQPNMMIESSGQGHNDPLMIGLVLAGVVLTIVGAGRATRGGLVLVTVSVAVKFISLPALGIVALTRLHRRRQEHGYLRLLGSWALDTLAVAAVLVGLFGPYWSGFSTIEEMVTQLGRLYTNPIWFDPYIIIRQFSPAAANAWVDITGPILQITAFLLAVAVLIRFGWLLWTSTTSAQHGSSEHPSWTRPLLISFAALFGIFAFVPVNTHPWYWTWPVVPIAILVAWDDEHRQAEPASHRWFVPYIVLTALLTLAYHTRIVMP